MKRAIKLVCVGASLVAVMGFGAASGSAHVPPRDDSSQDTSAPDHPECYNEAKLNDPSDFCYQTMGPWNSTRSSDEEVRRLMPVERMIAAGKPLQEIRQYYPDYAPAGK